MSRKRLREKIGKLKRKFRKIDLGVETGIEWAPIPPWVPKIYVKIYARKKLEQDKRRRRRRSRNKSSCHNVESHRK